MMSRITTATLFSVISLTGALLAGCSSVTPIESDVKSFAGLPGASTAKAGSFRFERLPSQQQEPAQASKMEGFAQPALEQVGFKRDDAHAQYSVQLGAYSMQQIAVPVGGWGPRYFYPGFDRWGYHHGFWGPGRWGPDPMYVSGVSVTIRELGTGKVVYETNATNEQRWFDPETVFGPMFIAAMKDFPAAPAGSRTISVTTAAKASK
jgi:hypothetical protein